MMLRRRFLLFCTAAAASAAAPVGASTYGSLDEARAMAERAAELLRTAGRERAFRAFNEAGNGFHDRDLYVFVWNNAGDCLAHGANPGLIGRNFISLRDVDGKLFIQEFTRVQETGWVDYRWRNPQANTVEPKTSFLIRVGDILIGVGAYKPS
jgi:signal transduction histidine kinase